LDPWAPHPTGLKETHFDQNPVQAHVDR
jgi:hypothetical protein